MKVVPFCAALVASFLVGCGSNSAPDVARAPVATPYYGFTDALNAKRREAGLRGLKRSGQLDRIAEGHAADMTRYAFFDHTGSDGSTPLKRVRRTGYNACYAAENIAWGQTSEEQVFVEWHASPSHRKNNLSKKATHYGLGRAGKNWVTVFASDC